jgi:stearoyl-CoA desaturase (delta-9 desaturase)
MGSEPKADLLELARRNGISLCARAAWRKRTLNAVLIGVPLSGTVYSVFYFPAHPPGWIELGSFLLFYLLAGVGVGVGYHRCFTHHSFRPVGYVKFALLFAGSLALQGSVIRWVADHRRHHRFADGSWDTHSPYAYQDQPIRSLLLGLFHAHIGWMFDATTTIYRIYAPDLIKDRMVLGFHYAYLPLTALSLALPYLFGWALGGPIVGFGCLLLGGCVRTTVLHNVIWGVNSVGHAAGSQEASALDHSRNNPFLAVMTLGEGWHNNHHAAPRAAYNRWRWHQLDLNGGIIRLLGWVGLVDNIIVQKQLPASHAAEDAIPIREQDIAGKLNYP